MTGKALSGGSKRLAACTCIRAGHPLTATTPMIRCQVLAHRQASPREMTEAYLESRRHWNRHPGDEQDEVLRGLHRD